MKTNIFPLPIERVNLNIDNFIKAIANKEDLEHQFQEGKRVLYEALDQGRICKDGFKAGMSKLAAARSRMLPSKTPRSQEET